MDPNTTHSTQPVTPEIQTPVAQTSQPTINTQPIIQQNSITQKTFRAVYLIILILLSLIFTAYGPLISFGILWLSGFGGGINPLMLLIALLSFFVPIFLVIITLWKNLARLKSTTLSNAKQEIKHLLPIIIVNLIFWEVFLLEFRFVLGGISAYINTEPILLSLTVIFFLYLFIILPKIVIPLYKSSLRNIILIVSITVLLLGSIFMLPFVSAVAKYIAIIPVLQQPVNDEARITAMGQIAMAMDSYFETNQKLPDNLTQIPNIKRGASEEPALREFIKEGNYKEISKTEYALCTNFDTSTLNKPVQPYEQMFKHAKGYYCVTIPISQRVIVPTVDPNYQPMHLSGGFALSDSKRGPHTLQAAIIGNKCSGIGGKTDNKITVTYDPQGSVGQWDWYHFSDWQIWDTVCGIEKGNAVSITLDGQPAGIRYRSVDNDCLPFVANRNMGSSTFTKGGDNWDVIQITASTSGGMANLSCVDNGTR